MPVRFVSSDDQGIDKAYVALELCVVVVSQENRNVIDIVIRAVTNHFTHCILVQLSYLFC